MVARHELPWETVGRIINPNGVASARVRRSRNPVGVVGKSNAGPRVASRTRQPWADRRNPFGIGRSTARIQAEFEQAQSLREHLAQKLAAVEKLPATLLREAFSGREQRACHAGE